MVTNTIHPFSSSDGHYFRYVGHKTPCHFEVVPGGKVKTQFTCPACGYVEKG